MSSPDPTYTDRQRAESFGAVAANYDRYRPTYPAQLIDDLVALGARSVLDAGCGTGKAAVLFAARGVDVLGVEIDPKMADIARSHGIPVEVSSFEQWDAAGRTFDLLVSGQAWHWVDPELGIPKAASLVRSGGAVAVFWNDEYLEPSVRRVLDAVYAEHAPQLLQEPSDDSRIERPHAAPFDASPSFDPVETRRYSWQQSYTADEWVGMCLTHSDHVLLPAGQRAALAGGLLAAITDLGAIAAAYSTYLLLAHRTA